MPRHLARHMDQHCAIPVLYASSWLLTAFASDFPIFFSSRVMDIILADRYLEAMMKVRFFLVMHVTWKHIKISLDFKYVPLTTMVIQTLQDSISCMAAEDAVSSQRPWGELR